MSAGLAEPSAAAPRHRFRDLEQLKLAIGTELGPGPWYTITQKQVDLFADATGDYQWIHVDPHRAASGPFGTTVAHGYLTVALIPKLTADLISVGSVRSVINYGLDRLRFPSPVPVGSRIRASCTIASVERIDDSARVRADVAVTREDASRPACVARLIVLYLL